VRDAGVIIGEAIAKDAREQGNNLRSSLTVADADSKVVFGRIGRAAGATKERGWARGRPLSLRDQGTFAAPISCPGTCCIQAQKRRRRVLTHLDGVNRNPEEGPGHARGEGGL
jgi:hypothetical protein